MASVILLDRHLTFLAFFRLDERDGICETKRQQCPERELLRSVLHRDRACREEVSRCICKGLSGNAIYLRWVSPSFDEAERDDRRIVLDRAAHACAEFIIRLDEFAATTAHVSLGTIDRVRQTGMTHTLAALDVRRARTRDTAEVRWLRTYQNGNEREN